MMRFPCKKSSILLTFIRVWDDRYLGDGRRYAATDIMKFSKTMRSR